MIYQHANLQVAWRGSEGLAELVLAAPGSVNKFDRDTLAAFGEAVATLSHTPGVRGLLIHSSKEAFVVGADITEFLGLFRLPKEELLGWLARANAIFNQLEDLPFPTLAAINGFALGGGCELVLATDYRLASPDLKLGLPETKLGIMPGFGGSVRLPRVIGADNAIEWIASGRDNSAEAALAVGAIDGIVTRDKLLTASERMLLQAAKGDLDWRAKRAPKLAPLALKGSEKLMSFSTCKAMVAAQAGRHYPAPLAATSAIETAADCDRAGALAIEAQAFVGLAQSAVAEALVGVFLAEQQVKAKMKQASKLAPRTDQAAVLGAGIMGGGIAYQGALKGTRMVMKDIRDAALELGMNEAGKHLLSRVDKGRMSAAEMAQVLGRIDPTLHYHSLTDSQLVVEAVVERADIKRQVLTEVEAVVSDNCVIATNTSTIPVGELASALRQPERFCGMHFFNPVHRMPLVEVIRGPHSSDAAIAAVVGWAGQMGKTAIVVNDCPGFFVNRVLFPYFAGFTQLVGEGADFAKIDAIMEKQFGWPMGPALLLDVVGLDTAHHAQAVMAAGYPERMAASADNAIARMVAAKRFGQKNGLGFYAYQPDKKGKPQKQADPAALALLGTVSGQLPDAATVIARLMVPMINETVRCLEEQIIASPADGDIALLYGLGFPPFRGGVFRYLDQTGIAAYLAQAQALAHLGPLYQPPKLLLEMADSNRTFYSR